MGYTPKLLKLAVVITGMTFLGFAYAYGEKKSNTDIKMADVIIFPQPEKLTVSVDPFVPIKTIADLSANIDADSDKEVAKEPEFKINDLKLQGIMILGMKTCVLIQEGNDIKKYSKEDMIHGYIIKDITTKGVEFEKDGNNILLANAAR